MRTLYPPALLGVLALAGTPLAAQDGALDQDSPFGTEAAANGYVFNIFNLVTTPGMYQQQVRAGMSGQLSAVVLEFIGMSASYRATVSLRLGPAWSTNPKVFTETIFEPNNDFQPTPWVFDTTAANIFLNAGDVFVIEVHTNDPAVVGVTGSTATSGGPPYAEPLFFEGTPCCDSLGARSRLGFETYMLSQPQIMQIGRCPGPVSVALTGGPPNGQVALVYCLGPGGPITVPGGYPCAGVSLDLNASATLAGVVTLDASGAAVFGPASVPAAACNVVRVQALSLDDCQTSNVLVIS